MSYIPLSTSEKDELSKQKNQQHRNPIYPSLKQFYEESEITSSLMFQQLLYFNWFYSFIEIYLYAGSQIYRFIYFDNEYGVPVRMIVGIIFTFLEIFRVQNAFYGNIKQSFPQICAFVMLTILTIAAQIILISGMVPPSPIQWSVIFYGIILHLLEFVVCIFQMGKLTQSQKALFLWRSPLAKLQ